MKRCITILVSLLAITANAQVHDWENPAVLGINKLPYHATLQLPSSATNTTAPSASSIATALPTPASMISPVILSAMVPRTTLTARALRSSVNTRCRSASTKRNISIRRTMATVATSAGLKSAPRLQPLALAYALRVSNHSASVPGTTVRRTLMLLPVIRKISSVAALSI